MSLSKTSNWCVCFPSKQLTLGLSRHGTHGCELRGAPAPSPLLVHLQTALPLRAQAHPRPMKLLDKGPCPRPPRTLRRLRQRTGGQEGLAVQRVRCSGDPAVPRLGVLSSRLWAWEGPDVGNERAHEPRFCSQKNNLKSWSTACYLAAYHSQSLRDSLGQLKGS